MVQDCLAAVALCIPVEDWEEVFTFIDDDDAAIAIADARAQIYSAAGVLLFDLTVGDGINIATNVVTLAIPYADMASYNTSVSNAKTTGAWDLLVQRDSDSALKRYLNGPVDFPKLYTPSIS